MTNHRSLSRTLTATLFTALLGLSSFACSSKAPSRPSWGTTQGGGDATADIDTTATSGDSNPNGDTSTASTDTSKNTTSTTDAGTGAKTTTDTGTKTTTDAGTKTSTDMTTTTTTTTTTAMTTGGIDPALKSLNDIAAPAKGQGVLVRVANKCPFPLWIHAAGAQGTLMPDDSKLDTNTVRSYLAPILWQSARVEAYKKGPREDNIDKVEMTFDHPGSTVNLNYNVTYVDWVGLPVNVGSVGTGADCKASGCSKPVGQLLNGCPDGLNDGERCISARTYCLNPVNQGKPYCHLLDDKVAECIANHDDCKNASGAGTPEVYACSGAFFSENPKYCAAINRGMLDDPTNANTKLYYTKGPFNSYSKWVHETCPNIYALAYDDYPPAAEESGYHSCVDGNELDVTFCPGG